MIKISILFILILLINCSGGKMNDPYDSIPEKIMDWQAVEKDEIYDRETLYDYINGGAEVYLAFDYQRLFVRRFQGPLKNEIVLDIYDMGSSSEAYGIFSCEREDEDAGIGQDSEYGAGLLRFWKDRFFVSIIAIGDEQISKPIILELGKVVAASIDSTGPKPALLRCLPEKELQEDKTSFFHSNINLNNRFFIASENILNLNNRTNCVFAEYLANNKDPCYLLAIQYENREQAEDAYQSFLKSYIPEAVETGLAKMENGKWTMANTNQNMVTLVFEAPDKNWASDLQITVKVKLNER